MLKIKSFLLVLLPIFLQGQVSFEPSSKAFGNIEIHSQIPIAIADINNDFLDDIVTLDKGNHLKVFYQSQNSEEYYYKDYGLVSTFDQLAIGVGDMDNDGIKEIFIGGYYDGIKVYKAFLSTDDYLLFKKTEATFYSQNISLVDIDKDGFLDIYVNDDDGPPLIFQNKNGSDFENVDWIDFGYEGEDASGNYGGIWTDFDNDNDLDLYISKCRLGVDDSEDIRRINQLYVNNGEGGFEELASDFNLDNGDQSWVSEMVDLDNDGDKDVVIINHTGGNIILENTGEEQYIVVNLDERWNQVFEGLQLIIRDFDNDGLKDILIGGFKSKLFWNKGDLLFEEEEGFIENKEALSFAVGDLNNDGFWDFYSIYAIGLTERNPWISDEILANKKNENSFLKINLKHESGNYDAIGSTCELYGDWGVQSYELRSGESYGINNSLSVIFGLGESTSFDSLVIKWPNGELTKVFDLELNSSYIISDSGCIIKQDNIEEIESNIICTENKIELKAPESTSYIWTNGAVTPSIIAENPGLYKVTLTNMEGCEYIPPAVFIKDISEVTVPIIYNLSPQKIYCEDDMVELRTQYDSVLWNNEIISASFYANVKDSVFATYILCDTLYSEIYVTELYKVETPQNKIDTITKGEDAVFHAEGESINWYSSIDGEDKIGEGRDFVVQNLQNDSTLYAENLVSEIGKDSITIGLLPIEFGLPPDNINGGIIFSVEQYNTILESVKCFTDTAAIRKIQVKNYWGSLIHEKEVFVSPSDSIIELNFDLTPSSYYLLTTDGNVNKENFGSRSPRFMRSAYDEGIYNIISEDGNVIIQGSTGSPDVYYSFYDWEIRTYEVYCTSERVGITVVVENSSSIGNHNSQNYSIQPNPFSDEIHVEGDINLLGQYSLFSVNGELVSQGLLERYLYFRSIEPGLYLLKIGGAVFKVVKL